MYSVYLSQMENNFHVPYSIRCPICSYLKHIFSSLVAVYVALGGGFWQCRDICRSYFSDMDAINTLGSINVYNSLDQVFHYLFAISINIQGGVTVRPIMFHSNTFHPKCLPNFWWNDTSPNNISPNSRFTQYYVSPKLQFTQLMFRQSYTYLRVSPNFFYSSKLGSTRIEYQLCPYIYNFSVFWWTVSWVKCNLGEM